MSTDQIFEDATSFLDDHDVSKMLAFNYDDDEIFENAKNVGYSGFDPAITFNICMKLINRDHSLMKKLNLLIVFGLTRGFGGNKTEKNILDKTNPDGRDILSAAFKSFRVQFGKPQSSKTITVSRIMSAFPLVTYKIFNQLRLKNAIKPTGYSGKLPQEFRYIGSIAVMSEKAVKEYLNKYLGFIEYVTEEVWGQEFDADTAERFAIISSSSKLIPRDSLIDCKASDEGKTPRFE